MSDTLSIRTAHDENLVHPLGAAIAQLKASAHHCLEGKVLVVKLGGSTLEHQRMVIYDLLYLQRLGVHPVLVHGGGPSINTMLENLHIPAYFEKGLRVTDAQTLEVVCMVLRGQINEHLVLLAASMGGRQSG